MKKIIKRAFLALLVLTIVFGAMQFVDVNLVPKAAAEQVSGFYTYVVEEGKATITDVDKKISGNAVVPSKLGGYPVTKIGAWAFSDCTELTGIVISDSVTSIYSHAFHNTGYYNKESNWQNGVLYIGKYLIEANVTASGAYEIKSGTRVIAAGAFKDCKYLTSIIIPDSVIGIDDMTFEGCCGLTSVKIGNGVTYIGAWAFQSCIGLTNLTIPNKIHTIGNVAFQGCGGLTSLTIPGTVTDIGSIAFESCTALKSLIIQNGVKNIGADAFKNCYGLTSVTIPDSVETIGAGAFAGCEGLTSMKVSSGNKTFDSRNGCNAIIETKRNLLVSGCAKTVIPNTITCINDYAFADFRDIKSMTLPDSVTIIGAWAFDGCIGMESIKLSNKLTTICAGAFYACTALKKIKFPDTLETISIDAFNYCYALETVDLGNSPNLSWGYNVFDFCTGIKKFTAGKDIKNYSIDSNGVLYNKDKTGLIKYTAAANRTTYTVNSNTVYIEERAFEGSKNLKSIVIPSDLMSISNAAFIDCDNLTDVYFLGSEKQWRDIYIGEYGNEALTKAKIHFGGRIGDLDNDGQINSSDALTVLHFAVGDIELTAAQRVFADVNRDGSINSQDALQILRYAVGELTSFD